MKTPTCPNCDTDLTHVYSTVQATWNYNDETGSFEEENGYNQDRTIKCPSCSIELEDTMGRIEQFNMKDETTDINGVQRRCEYCYHFDSNNDEEHKHEYAEGADGKCLEGGHSDIGDMTEPLTSWRCNAFLLCDILKSELPNIVLDDDTGAILEVAQG